MHNGAIIAPHKSQVMQRHPWQLNAPMKQHVIELEKLMFADVCEIHDSLALVTEVYTPAVSRHQMPPVE